MLRHLGTKRTYGHNVKLASLLCVTAGFVNAAGFLSFSVLTTNVTGHAALFAERIAMGDWITARVVALWMLLFLLGTFVSGVIVSAIGRNQRFSYAVPILLEAVVLLMVGLMGFRYNGGALSREFFAGSLLFVMGLQNALVSMISGSVVRTTHLTGTFTDLGIELGQMLCGSEHLNATLRSRIKLRIVIVFFFLLGALLGAYLFRVFHFHAFLLPVTVLLYTLFYDVFRINVKRLIRHWRLPSTI